MINVGKMLSEWSPTYSFMPLFPAPPVSAPEVRLTAQLEERLGTVRVKGDLPRLGNEDGCIFFELDECRVPVEGGDDGATVPSRLALMGGGRFKIDQWTPKSSSPRRITICSRRMASDRCLRERLNMGR